MAVVNNNQTQLSNPGGQGAQYFKHRSAGTFAGQANNATWSFDWTAPGAGVGQVTFYVAGNAANNNGSDLGDRIYATSTALQAFQNRVPEIDQPTEAASFDVDIETGEECIINLAGADADNDTLQWRFANRGDLPDEATLTDHGDGTATLNWTPAHDETGVYHPILSLTDTHAGSDQIELVITVSNGEVFYTLRLNASWNLISAPIAPFEMNTPRLWQELVDRQHLMMIKDQNGRFFIVAQGFSNLPAWDYRQAYYVRLSAADTIRFVGDEVAEDTPLPLRNGWNYVAYFPVRNLTAQVAFANIVNDITIAKDGNGRFFLPDRGFSNMGNLSRGNGYQVKTTSAFDFVWNIPEGQQIAEESHDNSYQSDPLFFDSPTMTGFNMSLLLSIRAPISELSDVGVFNENGLCVGAASISGNGPWGIAIWGDDPLTAEVDGATEGERLSVRFANSSSAEKATRLITFYETDGFSELRLDVAQPTTFAITDLYPNPFNSTLSIEYSLTERANLVFDVTDISGRSIANLAVGVREAGSNRITWDVSGLESGVYLIRMEVAGKSIVRKALFVK